MSMIDVAQLWCPDSGAPAGADGSTHHIVDSDSGTARCRYCHRDRAVLAAQAEAQVDLTAADGPTGARR